MVIRFNATTTPHGIHGAQPHGPPGDFRVSRHESCPVGFFAGFFTSKTMGDPPGLVGSWQGHLTIFFISRKTDMNGKGLSNTTRSRKGTKTSKHIDRWVLTTNWNNHSKILQVGIMEPRKLFNGRWMHGFHQGFFHTYLWVPPTPILNQNPVQVIITSFNATSEKTAAR